MQSISRAQRGRSSREATKRAQWAALEEFIRHRIQDWVQDLLEEEVVELLGRRKSERRAAIDAAEGYRNGHGKPRRLSMMAGTIELRRPRVRGLEQRFESRILPLLVRRTEQVTELLPQLYLHGLAQALDRAACATSMPLQPVRRGFVGLHAFVRAGRPSRRLSGGARSDRALLA
jgi:hypothetical protein